MPDCSACIDRQCPSRASCARYLMKWDEHRQSVSALWNGRDRCEAFMAIGDAPFRLVDIEAADRRAKWFSGQDA